MSSVSTFGRGVYDQHTFSGGGSSSSDMSQSRDAAGAKVQPLSSTPEIKTRNQKWPRPLGPTCFGKDRGFTPTSEGAGRGHASHAASFVEVRVGSCWLYCGKLAQEVTLRAALSAVRFPLLRLVVSSACGQCGNGGTR